VLLLAFWFSAGTTGFKGEPNSDNRLYDFKGWGVLKISAALPISSLMVSKTSAL